MVFYKVISSSVYSGYIYSAYMSRMNTIFLCLEDVANFVKNKSPISEECCGTNTKLCAQSCLFKCHQKLASYFRRVTMEDCSIFRMILTSFTKAWILEQSSFFWRVGCGTNYRLCIVHVSIQISTWWSNLDFYRTF